MLRASPIALVAIAMAGELEFNRDVRPILSENCFHCHGQDPTHREADLRLDRQEGAFESTDERTAAVVPGKPDESLLWKRITSTDPEVMMPPPTSHRSLKPEQIATLRRWIEEGAPYEKHWAFIPPVKAELPAKSHPGHQPLDAWIQAKQQERGLRPSPPAEPGIWLRRASFDLTGLAPTPEETAAFQTEVAAKGDAAYIDATDRLLASPRYGEHMAAAWLDLARYADTHGFNNDSSRNMWRWRDWVISAFNSNLPYDEFITRQMAGDLLPDADLESRIATGFNRNHVINSEGGIIDEEYRVEYVADRVRTVSTAWMGLTMECARCHDHKYDNISQKDYYQMFAFFNQVPEAGEAGRLRNAAPVMRAPTREQQEEVAKVEQEIAAARKALPSFQPAKSFVPPAAGDANQQIKLLDQADFPAAIDAAQTPKWNPNSEKAYAFATWLRWDGNEGVVFSSINYDGEPSAQGYAKGQELRVLADGRLDFRASERWPGYANQLRSAVKLTPGRWHAIALVNEGRSQNASMRLFVDFHEESLELVLDGLSGHGGGGAAVLGKSRGGPADPLHGTLAATTAWITAPELGEIDRHFESTLTAGAPWTLARPDLLLSRQALIEDESYRQAALHLQDLQRRKLALIRSHPTTMVMQDLATPRQSYVLTRGNYDAHGEEVQPVALSELLLAWPEDAPRNRLGLARWLTDPQNPLTARVVVNRFWQQVFGTGLVKTVEDFGVQGEYPSHPELLDWLARDFIETGWDVKRLMKSFVLSNSYRQSSRQTPDLRESDPENRLLARGPRVRLTGEGIRDHALNVGGLLVEKQGGPSVHPFQPEDYYKGMVVGANYPGTTWTDGSGDDLFRRSLYTFWKRTVPHPVGTNFDQPDREFCVASRSRTNTPLQALTLMNEKGLLHAAAGLGKRILAHSPDDPDAAVAYGFALTTGREPDADEARMLRLALDESLADWQNDSEAARQFLIDCGISEPKDAATEAAYTLVGSLLLNLDETVTKH